VADADADGEAVADGDALLFEVAAMATPTPPATKPTVMAAATTARRSRPPALFGGMCASFRKGRPGGPR